MTNSKHLFVHEPHTTSELLEDLAEEMFLSTKCIVILAGLNIQPHTRVLPAWRGF